MAAGAEAGDAELYVPRHRKGRQNDPGGRLIDTDHADGWRYRVAVNTLDAMNFGPVAFMKIDVEGFEEAALDGAWTTIERDRPALLVELEERILSGCRQRTVERLSSLGYRAWFLDNGRWNPEAELAEDQKGSSGRYINNFLFWPHEGLPPLAMPRPGNR